MGSEVKRNQADADGTLMIETAIKRSAQAVLHERMTNREEANRIGAELAAEAVKGDNFQEACFRYGTLDEFEIGQKLAEEYVKRMGTQ